MNKQIVTTLFAVGSAAFGSYYYGGYKERQKYVDLLPLQQQADLLHKVEYHHHIRADLLMSHKQMKDYKMEG